MSISTYQVKVDVVGITVICKMHENPRMYNARKNEKKTSKSSILYISLSQIIWTIWCVIREVISYTMDPNWYLIYHQLLRKLLSEILKK